MTLICTYNVASVYVSTVDMGGRSDRMGRADWDSDSDNDDHDDDHRGKTHKPSSKHHPSAPAQQPNMHVRKEQIEDDSDSPSSSPTAPRTRYHLQR